MFYLGDICGATKLPYTSAVHVMLPLDFPIVVSELGCLYERLILNYVCYVLEYLLMSKSLTQKAIEGINYCCPHTLAKGCL